MPYKILGNKLRVCEEIAVESKKTLTNARFIFLQHILEDTYEFISHIQANGGTIDTILAKQYSIDPKIYDLLQKQNLNIHKIDYSDIEKDENFLRDILLKALRAAKKNNQKLVVHEVGGYFHKCLHDIPADLKPYFAGVVEDTTYGHNKYKAIEKELDIPVFSVSRSQLKEIEASYVGGSIVSAFDSLMRDVGVSITGREALVIGYGMIGRNVAKTLKKNNIQTTVYDINSVACLHAFVRGHKIIASMEDLSQFDVIFSATGTNAIKLEDFFRMKDGVVLVSGGSKNIEFDVNALRTYANNTEEICEDITLFHLQGKKIFLLRNGTALNFRQNSVPNEIIDIVYAEILCAMLTLLESNPIYRPGLHELQTTDLSYIASKWLTRIQ